MTIAATRKRRFSTGEGLPIILWHSQTRFGSAIDVGEFPIVRGGDCSIVLGCLLAIRRRGRHGLLFLDGHADFYQPEAEPSGEVASIDLALATAAGPLS